MSRLEHSELVLGLFENLTNLGPDPLSQDDDDKLGFSGDENNGDDSVVVVDSDVDLLMNNMKDGVIAPVGYSTPPSWHSFVLVRCRSSTPQFYQQVDR